jgi:hypothetical protein
MSDNQQTYQLTVAENRYADHNAFRKWLESQPDGKLFECYVDRCILADWLMADVFAGMDLDLTHLGVALNGDVYLGYNKALAGRPWHQAFHKKVYYQFPLSVGQLLAILDEVTSKLEMTE